MTASYGLGSVAASWEGGGQCGSVIRIEGGAVWQRHKDGGRGSVAAS